MEQQRNNNREQSGINERSNTQQEKNETLQKGSASSVSDYGRSSEQLEERHGMESDRQGNSSIPSESDETMGNP